MWWPVAVVVSVVSPAAGRVLMCACEVVFDFVVVCLVASVGSMIRLPDGCTVASISGCVGIGCTDRC